MAGIKNKQAPTILSNGNYQSSQATELNTTSPSRLTETTQEIRTALMARNLYGNLNQYPLELNTTQKVVNAVSSVINIIMPFKSYNLENTVYGRLVTNPTPLTEIGLLMLGKQFAMNAASNIAQQTFPIIKPSNLFDGNKNTKLFEENIEYTITKQEKIGNFNKFLEIITGKYPKKNFNLTTLNAPDRNNIFIKNTGEGQLDILFKNLNRNIFKEDNSTLHEYAKLTSNEFVSGSISAKRQNKIFYNFFNSKYHPYLNIDYRYGDSQIVNANIAQEFTYETDNLEYAPNKDFIDTNMGVVNKVPEKLTIGDISEFRNDELGNQIVWGRDGVTEKVNSRLHILRGIQNDKIEGTTSPISLFNSHNVKSGLLNYTKNLLNATEGKVVDITRKAFDYGKGQHGFGGSGLWIANNSTYAKKSGIAGKQGVRQHTILDQYDRFTKTIRFNGNKVYESKGSPDSVIYESVMPRIHPTINGDKIDNKRLMFAIENLAVRTVEIDGIGIIDDENGSYIPVEEVGPFNGRIMWFPPYNIEFNETSTAKYESSILVGRNEPIYNYIHSERSCNFNFYLLIDYPPQLRNFTGTGEEKYKKIVDFFAFGGDKEITDMLTITNPDEKIRIRKKKIEVIKGESVEMNELVNIQPIILTISFPNDQPNSSQIQTVFNEMYGAGYEVAENLKGNDATNFGINSKIFAQIGFIGSVPDNNYRISPTWSTDGVSQYTTIENNELNNSLRQVFDDENNWGMYDITIIAGSSKLYYDANRQSQYNKNLGLRRAQATEYLIKQRLKALYPSTPLERLNITFNLTTNGSDDATDANGIVEAISNRATKEERYATIEIAKNSKNILNKDISLTSAQRTEIAQLNREIDNIETIKIQQKTIAERMLLNERKIDSDSGAGDNAILNKGKAFSENYYYPVFHSQTPEEFHRRLTFLQQCTRQGAAQRYDTINENGTLRAKNSVFGRQPICILRIGDFFYTKVIIESINVDYTETTWDMNPEGFGMQPMIAKITTQMKLIGGQSLKGPIDALQNAVSFNYYANSTFTDRGIYKKPSNESALQEAHRKGIDTGVYKTVEGKETRTGNLEYEKVLKLLEE